MAPSEQVQQQIPRIQWQQPRCDRTAQEAGEVAGTARQDPLMTGASRRCSAIQTLMEARRRGSQTHWSWSVRGCTSVEQARLEHRRCHDGQRKAIAGHGNMASSCVATLVWCAQSCCGAGAAPKVSKVRLSRGSREREEGSHARDRRCGADGRACSRQGEARQGRHSANGKPMTMELYTCGMRSHVIKECLAVGGGLAKRGRDDRQWPHGG